MTYNDHTLIFLNTLDMYYIRYIPRCGSPTNNERIQLKKKRHVVINISVRDKKAVD
jgi:hypothetical protein